MIVQQPATQRLIMMHGISVVLLALAAVLSVLIFDAVWVSSVLWGLWLCSVRALHAVRAVCRSWYRLWMGWR